MSRILLSPILASSLFCLCAAAARSQETAAPAEDDAAAIVEAEAADVQAAATEDDEADAEPAAPDPSPEAQAANEAFTALVTQWNGLVEQLKALQPQRDQAQGEARAALDQQMQDVRRQTTAKSVEIAEAALAVFRADPDAYPRVNQTLMAILQFFVIGDAKGDGGDQYERALPLIKQLIDAGGGAKWPSLYMLGGYSAFCVGELDLAEQYLTRAREEGFFANVPPQTRFDPPSVKLVQQASAALARLDEHRAHWEEEQKLRAAEAAADDLPRVKLSTTKGEIVLELFENEAPQAVANMITLVKKGYYDGVTFHRVLPLFMAQGGDPEGTGQGGPGYTIRDEYAKPGARRHFRGSLAMARTSAPNSGGSQFYLAFVPTSMLDGGYTVFGRVIEGIDVAASITRRDPDGPPPLPTPDRIIKAEVLRDRGHAYEFEQLAE